MNPNASEFVPAVTPVDVEALEFDPAEPSLDLLTRYLVPPPGIPLEPSVVPVDFERALPNPDFHYDSEQQMSDQAIFMGLNLRTKGDIFLLSLWVYPSWTEFVSRERPEVVSRGRRPLCTDIFKYARATQEYLDWMSKQPGWGFYLTQLVNDGAPKREWLLKALDFVANHYNRYHMEQITRHSQDWPEMETPPRRRIKAGGNVTDITSGTEASRCLRRTTMDSAPRPQPGGNPF